MKYLIVAISAVLLFAYLALTDGTNLQIVGLVLAVLAIPVYFRFRSRRRRAES